MEQGFRPASRLPLGCPNTRYCTELNVQGLDNKTIMIRFDIPESTFYRHLAHAVEALADELWQQEQLLAARRPNPVALDYLG